MTQLLKGYHFWTHQFFWKNWKILIHICLRLYIWLVFLTAVRLGFRLTGKLSHARVPVKFWQSGVPIWSSKPKRIRNLWSLSGSNIWYWNTKFVFARMPNINPVRISSKTTLLTQILICICTIFGLLCGEDIFNPFLYLKWQISAF